MKMTSIKISSIPKVDLHNFELLWLGLKGNKISLFFTTGSSNTYILEF